MASNIHNPISILQILLPLFVPTGPRCLYPLHSLHASIQESLCHILFAGPNRLVIAPISELLTLPLIAVITDIYFVGIFI